MLRGARKSTILTPLTWQLEIFLVGFTLILDFGYRGDAFLLKFLHFSHFRVRPAIRTEGLWLRAPSRF